MSTLLTSRPVVNSAPAPDSAADWPAWTDADRWELGPDEADRRWAAENLADPTDWHDQDGSEPSDDEWDRRAEDSVATDRHERGLCL
jgi:hypothetical protein